jgi:hypothetical protein
LVVHPEVSQLLHDVGPVLGRIWVVKLYSSHGTQHAAPEQPTANRLKCKFSLSLSRFWIGYGQIEIQYMYDKDAYSNISIPQAVWFS